MNSDDWDGDFVNDYFSRTKFPNEKEASQKWWALADRKRSSLLVRNSENNARKILIEFHKMLEKEADEFIEKMKREMKLQAFK